MKSQRPILLFAFLCGLGAQLFVPSPVGYVAMFDAACFVLGPYLFVLDYKKWTRQEHRLLTMAMLWTVGSILSNLVREEDFFVALKGNAIVFNVWCMLVVGIWMFKKNYKTFLWSMVGAGIGNVVSLYIFQNGAMLAFAYIGGYEGEGGMQDFLLSKQVWPSYVLLVIFSVLWPLVSFGWLSWLPVIAAVIGMALYLLIACGARSLFGSIMFGVLYMIGYVYCRTAIRAMFKNVVLAACIGGILAGAVLVSYKYMARKGFLGDEELNKYEAEYVDAGSVVFGGRTDLFRAWPFLKHHPFVGAGASYIDRWGYIKGSKDGTIPAHSVVTWAWVSHGILGLLFWLYAVWLLIRFIVKQLLLFHNWSPFVMIWIALMLWNIWGSPFGGYRGSMCFILALCVVAKDNLWMMHVERDLARSVRKRNRMRPACNS